jgi:plastocyanin
MVRAPAILLLLLSFATAATGEPARPAKKSVSIKDMQFQPAAIEVQAGDTVTWTNNDDRDHTVVADDGSFKSDNISAGGKFVYKFTKAGKFSYACSYHPRMKGTVTVTD